MSSCNELKGDAGQRLELWWCCKQESWSDTLSFLTFPQTFAFHFRVFLGADDGAAAGISAISTADSLLVPVARCPGVGTTASPVFFDIAAAAGETFARLVPVSAVEDSECVYCSSY